MTLVPFLFCLLSLFFSCRYSSNRSENLSIDKAREIRKSSTEKGEYEVICKDSTVEVISEQDFTSNNLCPNLPADENVQGGLKYVESAGVGTYKAYCVGATSWKLVTEAELLSGTACPSTNIDPQPLIFKQISVGSEFACGVTDQEDLYCWGKNNSGQLGNGSKTHRSWPTLVKGIKLSNRISGFSRIVSTGYNHACALLRSGRVKCWGEGKYGQLGVFDQRKNSSIPMDISARNEQLGSEVTAGSNHNCWLETNGNVTCWGAGALGQIGDGHYFPENESPQLPISYLIGQAKKIFSGTEHNCAILKDDSARCWGFTDYGQTAVRIPSGEFVEDMALGNAHTCALTKTTKELICWGNNARSQLGNGDNKNSADGVKVIGIKGKIVKIEAASHTTCAINSENELFCWGDLAFLGKDYIFSTEKAQKLQSGISNVSIGFRQLCTTSVSKELKCWGSNKYGQLGNGTRMDLEMKKFAP